MIISREWNMPSKNTFTIPSIRKLILRYVKNEMVILDPFANDMNIKKDIPETCKYISNDLNEEFATDYHMKAVDFLEMFDSESVDLVLLDPPYSPRQVKEVYDGIGIKCEKNDTNDRFWNQITDEINRVLKPKGMVIICGWNSNGMKKDFGFETKEILLVAHGGRHNDTIVTVEEKQFHQFNLF